MTTRTAPPVWLTITLVVIVVAGLGIGAGFYRTEGRSIRREVETNLAAVAELKVKQLADWRVERLHDAAVLTEDPLLAAAVAQWLERPTDALGASLTARFASLADHYGFRQVGLVEPPQGPDRLPGVALALSGFSERLNPELTSAVATAFGERRPVLTDLHAGQDGLPPSIDLVAPIVSGGSVPAPLAAIVLRTDLETFLYPYLQSWPVPSATAETLLVRSDGAEVLFLNELRHQHGTAFTLRLPLSRSDLPAVMAVEGAEGVVRGRDYRGVEVLAAVRSVPGTQWYLVAKVDVSEALAAWRSQSRLILVLVAGLLLASASTVLVVWQRRAKSHYRALYEAEAARGAVEARYTATLRSIGDGVIATDDRGRVELMNPVAESLTGWLEIEARGRPLDEVFQLVEESTGEPVEGPVARVLRTGTVVGLADSTLLISRGGTEVPVADSGAPIRDRDGRVTGTVLVFRDQTEERSAVAALRHNEQRFRLLADHTLDLIWQMDLETRFTYVNPAVESMLGWTPEEFIGTSLGEHCDPERLEMMLGVIAHELEHLSDHSGVVFDTVVRHRDGHALPVEIHGKVLTDDDGRPVALQGTTRDVSERKRLEVQLLQSLKLEAVGRLAGGIAHDFNNILQAILGYTELAESATDPGSPLVGTLHEIRTAARRSADLTRQLLGFARRQTVQPTVLDLNDSVAGMLKMLRPLIGEDIDLVWRPGGNLHSVLIDPTQVDQVLTNLVANARDAISGVGKVTIETSNVHFDQAYCDDHVGFIPGHYVMMAVSDDGRGIDRESLEHLFEPFYTTKAVGQGTGLGLATVYGIVSQNKGFINVYSEPDSGTTFKVYLPKHGSGEVKTQNPAPPGEIPLGDETVLIVEDEPAILRLCASMLARLGYFVLTARTPSEALQVVEQHPQAVDLLLTDVVMPEMTGRDLALTLQGRNPTLRCLYMSGYTANVIAHRGVLDREVHFIQKPFSLRDLALKAREALEAGAKT